ncbi:MAG TPA: hypothetical protein DD490_12805 [Acidobacteria bacterium]|nr:hypothetical protein [Acidobacteriota bacterium]
MRVAESPAHFTSLIEAARALGLRLGWLDLAPPPTIPGDLETAAALGTLRAVAAGGGRAVAVKPLKGDPVLKDLLREHFRGCALVLLRGESSAPRLTADGDGWTVHVEDAVHRFTTTTLAEALRTPRPPWAPPPIPRPPRPPKKVKKTKQEKKRDRVERRRKKPEGSAEPGQPRRRTR